MLNISLYKLNPRFYGRECRVFVGWEFKNSLKKGKMHPLHNTWIEKVKSIAEKCASIMCSGAFEVDLRSDAMLHELIKIDGKLLVFAHEAIDEIIQEMKQLNIFLNEYPRGIGAYEIKFTFQFSVEGARFSQKEGVISFKELDTEKQDDFSIKRSVVIPDPQLN